MSNTLAGLATLVALTATVATAAAESYEATPPEPLARGYVGVGASIGVQRAIQGGFFIDGGTRIAGSPLFAHGQLTGGTSGDAEGGSFAQLRIGIEARGCVARQVLCAFGGADAGYQRDHVRDSIWFTDDVATLDAHDAILVPRIGLEAGSKLRARLLAELPMYQQLDRSDHMTYSERGAGVTVSLAVAGVF